MKNLLIAPGLALALLAGGHALAADKASDEVVEARQETQIWTTYALSPHLRANDLKVSVQNGKATLTGTVEEDVSRDLAKQIALGVEGIRQVDNQIKVQPDYTPAAKTDERGYGERIDDATITAAVKSKLVWSRQTEGLTATVDTERGKVRLGGTADSAESRDMAGKLAMNTRGVSSVDNRIVIAKAEPGIIAGVTESGQDAGQSMTDGWITTKVKATYMYSSNVDSADISVSTAEGIVSLSGKVSDAAQRALAIELARNIRGVKSVDADDLTI
ncbi:BON domain-containing protein [Sinimarinibacterium flocculans]|uniref:BON domain-containing protein n=1 Tax=Sinimarinibacterium flocculans TaxID=985250 RepID=UPI0024913668|nr:BON domain-containing protein [Sinimarinibacterium flocculans]